MSTSTSGNGGGSFLRPLVHRPYRRIFVAATASNLGDWVNYVAVLIVIAFRMRLGAGWLAAYAVALAVPYVLFSPLAGVVVDRVPRRLAMVTCDLGRAVVVLCFVLAHDVWLLLGLVVLRGLFSSVFNPAESAAVKQAVPKDDLLAANSLNSLSTQLTKIVGPSIGGVVVALAGPDPAFYLDAASFCISAAFLAGMRLPAPAAPAPGSHPQKDGRRHRVLAEIAEGFAYIRRSRALTVAIAGMAVTVFMVFTFDTLSPLALRSLGLRASLFGFAVGCIGAGAALGAVAIGQYGRRRQPFLLMGSGNLVAGALVALVGSVVVLRLMPPVLVWLPVALGIGFASSGVIVPYPYVIQSATPESLLGRVMSSAGSVPTALQLCAPPIGAAVATAAGVGVVLLAAGCGLAALGVVICVLRPSVGAEVETREETTMEDAAEILRAGGFELASAPPAERAVLEGLSPAEAELLVNVKERLDACRPEVVAHEDTGGTFW